MLRPQLRQLSRHRDFMCPGRQITIRHFSIPHAAAAASQSPGPSAGPKGSKQNPKPALSRAPRPSNRPPSPSSKFPPHSGKVIDARSFAASRTGGESANVIRSPRLRNVRGNQPQSRKPKPATSKTSSKSRRSARPRRSDNEVDDGEHARAAAIQQIEQEQLARGRPVPVRYEPQNIDFSTLSETWPAFPTTSNGKSAAVLEKLSSIGGRRPNGAVPPGQLAWRLWTGEHVFFKSEAEKSEIMAAAQQISQYRADKKSQRRGELVEPSVVSFKPVIEKDSNRLMETLAQGKYPALKEGKSQPAVIGDLARNLRNNATYHTPSTKPRFLGKVESLLASSRAKRT
ncbi:hypothetical protein N7462_008766 [Penicillium macrosclerotiorum]|uniref:uncharacterized protein n=1 Tax=Penicillium macrosclerotiorum TaxID=303699 RepID=UPI0025479133|nr:uncharacterized protein N7462_008766 [Penicillium macrosclerotiorum]KAJ5675869.1 hypothetical protein N7462_008766 [Penicillium macrosclerotiorum]